MPRDAEGALCPGLSFAVETADRRFGVKDFEILGVTQEEVVDGVRMLVRVRLPGTLPVGAARLSARLTEPATGLHWQESTGLVVVSRGQE